MLDPLALAVVAGGDELSELGDVGQPPGHHRGRRQAVAAGAAGLLIVGLEALGRVEVVDEAHVRLVDAHPERDRGDDDAHVIVDEPALGRAPDLRGQPGVIGQGTPTLAPQLCCRLLGAPAGEAVDDAGVARGLGAQEADQLGRGVALGRDPVADVRAIEAAEEHARRFQAQLGRDLAPGRQIGGRGQRDPGHLGPALVEHGELEIFRAEVMAPLRDAVRLVDREQRDRDLVEPGQETVGQKPLRRQVEKIELARFGLAANPALLLGRQAGVQEGRAQAELAQRHHLILHERDQRADDDRRAGPEQGGNLVAQRLAAAGGHDDQRVAAGDHTAHDRLLLAPEGAEAEDVVQERSRVARPARRTGRTCHGRRHGCPRWNRRRWVSDTDG